MTGEVLRFAVEQMAGLGGLLLPVFVVVLPFSVVRRRLL